MFLPRGWSSARTERVRNGSSFARAPGHALCAAGGVLVLLVVATTPGTTTGARGSERSGVLLSGTVAIEGLANADGAVVYLVPVGGSPMPLSTGTAVIDQKGLDFRPHVLVVPVSTAVAFHNSDTVLHNIFAPDLGPDPAGETFDLGTWPAGESKSHRFMRPGVTTLLCNVHPEMEAFVVVVPTRYFAVTGPEGEFRIPGVPVGDYVVHVWHERCPSIRRQLHVEADGNHELQLLLLTRTS